MKTCKYCGFESAKHNSAFQPLGDHLYIINESLRDVDCCSVCWHRWCVLIREGVEKLERDKKLIPDILAELGARNGRTLVQILYPDQLLDRGP